MRNPINPAVLIGVVVAIVGAAAYFFWLRPSMQENKIRQEWTSDAAVNQRGPNAPRNAAYEAQLQELRAKERNGQAVAGPGASRRE